MKDEFGDYSFMRDVDVDACLLTMMPFSSEEHHETSTTNPKKRMAAVNPYQTPPRRTFRPNDTKTTATNNSAIVPNTTAGILANATNNTATPPKASPKATHSISDTSSPAEQTIQRRIANPYQKRVISTKSIGMLVSPKDKVGTKTTSPSSPQAPGVGMPLLFVNKENQHHNSAAQPNRVVVNPYKKSHQNKATGNKVVSTSPSNNAHMTKTKGDTQKWRASQTTKATVVSPIPTSHPGVSSTAAVASTKAGVVSPAAAAAAVSASSTDTTKPVAMPRMATAVSSLKVPPPKSFSSTPITGNHDDQEWGTKGSRDETIIEWALYNYEGFFGLPRGSVSFDQVQSSAAGISGWAAMIEGGGGGVSGGDKAETTAPSPEKKKTPTIKGDAVEDRQLQNALLESIGACPPRSDYYYYPDPDVQDGNDDDHFLYDTQSTQ